MNHHLFRIGWILVIVTFVIAMIKNVALEYALTVAYFPIVTLCLLRKRDFPLRDAGLNASWIGPLLLTSWMVVYFFIFQPLEAQFANAVNPPVNVIDASFRMLVWRLVGDGVVATLLIAWFAMGFGNIPTLAFAATILPSLEKSDKFNPKSLEEYKPTQKKWVWAMLIFFFVMKMIPAALVYNVSREAITDLRETDERIEQMRKARQR